MSKDLAVDFYQNGIPQNFSRRLQQVKKKLPEICTSRIRSSTLLGWNGLLSKTHKADCMVLLGGGAGGFLWWGFVVGKEENAVILPYLYVSDASRIY
ncbi:MAG: hypothetical protein U9N54_04495 [candidate division Zixibacteria bacterium]|nr:hypothetical protein [candidate division Zixibacteria bacterium]